MRVLLVDDEGSILLTLAANLELEGFEVECASSGAQALDLMERQHFDIVLSDVRMPGMNGVDLFRRIRSKNTDIPVLLMTGFAIETLIEDAINEGVFAVLPKPFEIEHMISALIRASRRPTVLFVSDAEEARATAAAISAMGVACRALIDPTDVLAAVRERAVDVCVVDLASAEVQGPELMEQILAIDRSIVVIAVTQEPVASALRRVAALGAFACIGKPVEPARLVHLVASARAKWQPARRRIPGSSATHEGDK